MIESDEWDSVAQGRKFVVLLCHCSWWQYLKVPQQWVTEQQCFRSNVASQAASASNSKKSRYQFWHLSRFLTLSHPLASFCELPAVVPSHREAISEQVRIFLLTPSWDNQQLVQSRVISCRWLKTINMIKHGGGYFEAVWLKPSHRVMQCCHFCKILSTTYLFTFAPVWPFI